MVMEKADHIAGADDDISGSSSTSSVHAVDLAEDREWQDVEDDSERLIFVSLFDEGRTFTSLEALLEDCKAEHGFDLAGTIQRLELDFLTALKLVNYVRSEVRGGNRDITVKSKDDFADEKFLHPVLEDDAVLFSIDDLVSESTSAEVPNGRETSTNDSEAHVQRILELEEQLRRTQQDFADYRQQVEDTLHRKWMTETPQAESSSQAALRAPPSEQDKYDNGYFDSYAYNDIHQTMLKDKVRTDAYRDFIYENKDVFAGKVVLDVGCGTGILSMFCARAGAAKVYAVDNSAIIDKARANVHENGLDEIISCLRGKIEDVILPVPHVDIVVSEWMGYCLLFEAMLDSVLYARDRWLRPGGLMVPSHCTLHVAPIRDEEYINDNISFWSEVYGFGMSAMREKIFDDILVRHLEPNYLLAEATNFLTLPLYDVRVADLSFTKSFEVQLADGNRDIDGWCVWFDTYFLRSPSEALAKDTNAKDWKASGKRGVAFTTGPFGTETHWKSGVMLIDPKNAGDIGEGRLTPKITYSKGSQDNRALEICIEWLAGGKERKQTWFC